MKTSIGELDGNGWQEHCDRLLRQKYNNYQKIPSRFGGDLGLEGYSKELGIVCQCYCPDGNPTTKELYKAQRNKITRDIRKLISNCAEIKKILGECKIKEWQFLTPDYDSKEILIHCQKKENEVKLAKKDLIDNQKFRIIIKIEKDFILELDKIRNMLKINPAIEDVSEEKVVKWGNFNNRLLNTLENKGQKIINEEKKLEDFVKKHIYNFLMGTIALEKLRINFPSLHQQILETKSTIEHKIELESMVLTSAEPKEMIQDALTDYKLMLKELSNDTLHEKLKMILCLESISDWLIRCPLDFN